MSGTMLIKMVPADQYPKLTSYMGIAVVMAMVLGPIVRGAICQHTTWRWIFHFNGPVGVLALLLALFGIPNRYPHHDSPVKLAGAKASELMARIRLLYSLGSSFSPCL